MTGNHLRGISLLVALNGDRILTVTCILVALAAGAALGGLQPPP